MKQENPPSLKSYYLFSDNTLFLSQVCLIYIYIYIYKIAIALQYFSNPILCWHTAFYPELGEGFWHAVARYVEL